MQMVAATKMRRAQQAAIALRPYARASTTWPRIFTPASAPMRSVIRSSRSAAKRQDRRHRPHDREGPVRTAQHNLLREVLRNDDASKVYLSVGKKGRQVLTRLKKDLLADFELKDSPTFAESKTISRFVLQKFEEEAFDTIEIYYNRFVNTLSQVPTRFPLVPIGADTLAAAKARGKAKHNEMAHPKPDGSSATLVSYNFEPDAARSARKLLPYYIHLELYEKILESRASEHSARMVAMKAATDNAKQLVKDLTLEYNKRARPRSRTRSWKSRSPRRS